MALDKFIDRHNGPRSKDIELMLNKIGVKDLDELIDKTVPPVIRLKNPIKLSEGISEYEYLQRIWEIASKNQVYKTYIGQGYYNAIFPSVIQRNILENPGWYTSYTPYQAEISQGRLEALLNFQTVIMDMTAMEIANASLLDEATAAAEAMIMMFNSRSRERVKAGAVKFFLDENVFPQNMAVLKTRAFTLNIELVVGKYMKLNWMRAILELWYNIPLLTGKYTTTGTL
jgi:glycine dehydrogenase